MIKVIFMDVHGQRKEVEAAEDQSLMQVAVENRIAGIEAVCGGSMVCGTCHAYIAEPWFSRLGVKNEGEAVMLEYGVHIENNSRLLCQVPVTKDMDGIEIVVPPSQVSN